MYKIFQKKFEKDLASLLDLYNFKYIKKDKVCIGFYENLIFRISYDKVGYGSRVEITMEYDYPLIRDNLIILPKYHMNFSALAENKNWIINNERKEDSQQIDIRVDKYILDMKFIFENYFYILASRIVNSFDIETFIEHEYNNLFDEYLEEVGEEDPAWTYQEEFMNSGKLQEDWTEDDGAKCQELTKAMQDDKFPYEKIKEGLLKTIEKNKTKYDEDIQNYFDEGYKFIKIDENIVSISLKNLLDSNKIIETKLINLGFTYNSNKNTQGLPSYGETLYYQKENYELLVILKDELFLEFIIQKENYSKRVNIYDGSYFWFGWLVGKESTREHNINEALNKLESEIVKQSVKNYNPNTH